MKKIFLLVLLVMGSMCLCLSADGSGLLTIKEIPRINFKTNRIVKNIGEYNGYGEIDEIFSNRIVINDSNFNFASKVKVITVKGHNYSNHLNKGMHVYYFLNKTDKINKIVVDTGK